MCSEKFDKSVKVEGNNQAPVITGDNNQLSLSITEPKTIHQAYTQWISQTKINLHPNLILKSREEQTKELLKLLSLTPSKIIIVSSSEQESYAFIITSLKDNQEYSDRVKVVTTQESWDSLLKETASHILIYQGFIPNNIGVAITQGHFVIEAEESINIKDKSHQIIKLPKIRKTLQIDTLQQMGLSHDNAWEVYSDTKGFLYAIAQHPILQPLERVQPSWVSKYSMDILSTILFVNSWHRQNESDIKIMEQLSGLSYEALEQELFNLRKEKTPPIRLVGNVWQVISKINLWDMIADKISIAQIDRLRSATLEIFSEIDPAYELPPEERSYAHIYHKKMKYSGLIRESLADTLVLLSVFGSQKVSYAIDINEVIAHWLTELFESNLNVEAWYSYHQNLMLLAEASPKSFLTALEKSLDDIATTKIEELFIENGDAWMGECDYCHLLWALERVSWNVDVLPRVILVLAKLSALEIKVNRINQPFNSLKDIFLGWVPHCSATHQEQIQIIENILLKQYPDIGWKLLLELLPDFHMTSSPINSPKYQDWNETLNGDILEKDYWKYCEEINRLLYENIDIDLNRWYGIFDNIDKFYQRYFFEIIDKFTKIDKSLLDDEIRLLIANLLREKIHRHRSHPDADWALPKEFVDKLEEAFLFIEPASVIDKYQYLFDSGSINILNPIPYDAKNSTENFQKEDELVDQLRHEAILEILTKASFEELVKLVKRTDYSGIIGQELFLAMGDNYYETMLEWLESENNHLFVCARNYITQYIRANPFDENILESLTDKQKSEILLVLPFEAKTFEILKKQTESVQKLYWQNINWYFRLEDEDISYINWIIEQLYSYGFVGTTFQFISHQLYSIKKGKSDNSIDINILFKILYEIDPNDKTINRSDISEVIGFLQKSDLKDDELRFLEWRYLMLQSFNPIHWEKLIINEPKVFAELISYMYKPKNPRDEDSDLTQEQIDMRYTNAKELLQRVHLFREYEDIERMNTEKLKAWVRGARNALKEFDRVKIGDDRLGVFLAKSSKEEDGIFPNKMVCEVIEEFGSKEFEEGFIHEIIYPNGTRSTQKAHDSGGELEHGESAKYLQYADAIRFTYPKTSQLLRKVSDWYLREAKREDLRSELR
ncbi:MAG: hypothetical protein K0U38_09720 [Epsilonproteobacteria bacterium]|nr:hypothetical protein [Campylobacterota bacterium]